jgi:predicted amidohydrolase YtcJ
VRLTRPAALAACADFTVLERDPCEVDPLELKDIGIWGTVFDGEARPLAVSP